MYAQRRFDTGKIIFMHRQIIDCPPGYFTDHKDGNGLNNQKDNLRICTKSQNSMNSGKHKNNQSKYKGVSFDKSRNKWVASICLGKFIIHKRFNNKIDAAKFYNAKALELHKEFAYLNDIPCAG